MANEIGPYPRLLGYVRPYWRIFALSILCLVLLAATEPALPALLKPMLDGSFVDQNPSHPLLVPSLIVVLFILRGVLSYCSDVSIAWVAHRVVADMRAAMFRRLVALPASFYDDTSSGALISKLSFDVAQVQQASTRVLTVLVKDSLGVLALLGYMIYLNWRLAVVFVLLAPVVAGIVLAVSDRLRRNSALVQSSMGDLNHVAEEAIECHKVVKVFGGQAYEISRFEAAVDRARKYAMKVVRTSAANVPLIQIVLSVGIAVVVFTAVQAARRGEITVGGVVAFFAAMAMLLPAFKRLTAINEHLQRGLAAAGSVFELMDRLPEFDDGGQAIGRVRGRIEFRDVSFRYVHDQEGALYGINLRIEAGETVAFVGASGSGKSTLVSLVPRFYPVTEGAILIDGIDIRDITLASLRANIALVSQDIALFNDTVYSNIAYGALGDVRADQVLAAAEAAHVMEFVGELPQGLETLVGEDGVRLSGGQRQRLAMARALLKDAPILILDEATSALDSASEARIQSELNALRSGRTCLIVAHRLSTIEGADRIVVLERGRVVEVGRHDQLIVAGGRYAGMWALQTGGAEQPVRQPGVQTL
jgi:subfamily B ATP-binding cassette protein MsbA